MPSVNRTRHELTAGDGERVARALVRRETTLTALSGGLAASAVVAQVALTWAGVALAIGYPLITLALVGSALAVHFYVRRERAGDLAELAGTPGARATLIGDQLEIATPERTMGLPASRAELRRLRIGALPAARALR